MNKDYNKLLNDLIKVVEVEEELMDLSILIKDLEETNIDIKFAREQNKKGGTFDLSEYYRKQRSLESEIDQVVYNIKKYNNEETEEIFLTDKQTILSSSSVTKKSPDFIKNLLIINKSSN